MTCALCFNCGGVKFGAWCPCMHCGVASSGRRDLDILFSDHNYSESTLAAFGEVIRRIGVACDDDEKRFWAFVKYVSDRHPDVLTAELGGPGAPELAVFLSSLDLPQVQVEVSDRARLRDRDGGATALHEAAREGDCHAAARLMAEGADVNAEDAAGSTPLCSAAWYGHADVAGLLLERDADPNAGNPLHAALLYDHREIVKMLIARGADVNAVDLEETPLSYILQYMRPGLDLVELLIASGADVNLQPRSGLGALFKAASEGRADVVDVLIRHGADTGQKDARGDSPLHWAARFGNAATVRALLDNGADPAAVGNDGKTPLDLAVDAGQQESARFIRERMDAS